MLNLDSVEKFMAKRKQIRLCVVTRKKIHKKNLIRITKYNNQIQIDITGKKEGRGCYVYPSYEVYQQLVKSNFAQISKALKKSLSDNEKEYLKNELPKFMKSEISGINSKS